jgi:hypothetical protein
MLGPVALALLGIAAAFGPVLFVRPDPPAWAPFALFLGACAWAALEWRRKRGAGRLALAGALAAGSLGYAWWFFLASDYDPVDAGPAMRTTAPDFEAVRVLDGARFRLAEERGRYAFLVFFRGAW